MTVQSLILFYIVPIVFRFSRQSKQALFLCVLVLLDEFCVKAESDLQSSRQISHVPNIQSPVTFVDQIENDVGKNRVLCLCCVCYVCVVLCCVCLGVCMCMCMCVWGGGWCLLLY